MVYWNAIHSLYYHYCHLISMLSLIHSLRLLSIHSFSLNFEFVFYIIHFVFNWYSIFWLCCPSHHSKSHLFIKDANQYSSLIASEQCNYKEGWFDVLYPKLTRFHFYSLRLFWYHHEDCISRTPLLKYHCILLWIPFEGFLIPIHFLFNLYRILIFSYHYFHL